MVTRFAPKSKKSSSKPVTDDPAVRSADLPPARRASTRFNRRARVVLVIERTFGAAITDEHSAAGSALRVAIAEFIESLGVAASVGRRRMIEAPAAWQASCHALTVDVEEWFHICGVGGPSSRAWPSLDSRVAANDRPSGSARSLWSARRFSSSATAERHPDLIAEPCRGPQVGSHGHMHDRVYDLTSGVRASDRSRTARGVARWRAPSARPNGPSTIGRSGLDAREERFAFDSSMAPCASSAIPSIRKRAIVETNPGSIVECPPAVAPMGQAARLAGWCWWSEPRRSCPISMPPCAGSARSCIRGSWTMNRRESSCRWVRPSRTTRGCLGFALASKRS